MKIFKWTLIGAAGLVVLLVAALLVIPLFVGVEKYKPEIESRISAAAGLPVSIAGDLRFSLFPWAGVAFSDLRVGNPPGFKEKTLLSVKKFEVKVKLLPLLSRDVQVKGLVVEGSRLVLEKTREGSANWVKIGKGATASPSELKKTLPVPGKSDGSGMTIRSLAVGLVSVRKGSVLWVDESKGVRKEISDLGLEVKEASLDRPISFLLTAVLEGQKAQVNGVVGPLGHEPMKGSVPLTVAIKAFDELAVNLTGKVQDIGNQPEFDLSMDMPAFSARNLVRRLGGEFPVNTSDPKTFGQVALKCSLKGGPAGIVLSDGSLGLDDTRILFTANIRDTAKPDLVFSLKSDQVDLDRYLPPKAEKKPPGDKSGKPQPEQGKKTDYTPLRRAVLEGEIRAGKLKVMDAVLHDAVLKIRGKDGLFDLNPIGLSAYEGTVAGKAELDVRMEMPKSQLQLDASGLKARPLLKDMFKKDFLEGTAQAKLALRMEGDEPPRIKRTLNGNGHIRFADGAIIGIDLPGMARDVKSAFGLEQKSAQKPKTDFSELVFPFTVKDGVVQTPGASLVSPFLRVTAEGTADLNQETLNMRLEPKAVATMKGQGDTGERSGIAVPILVTGSFSSPQFAPDLQGILQKGLKGGLPSREDLEGILKGKGPKQDGAPSKEDGGPSKNPRDTLKDLLKGFGR